jgi:hypothetical protein
MWKITGKTLGYPVSETRFEAVTFQILSRSATHSSTLSADMKMEEEEGRVITFAWWNTRTRFVISTANTVQFQISRAGKRIAWPSI